MEQLESIVRNMLTHRKFFVRGIIRLVMWAAITAALLFVFNIIGYFALTYGCTYLDYPSNFLPANSYWGRVFSLIFIGAVDVMISVFIIGAAILLLFGCYYGILRIGGYNGSASTSSKRNNPLPVPSLRKP